MYISCRNLVILVCISLVHTVHGQQNCLSASIYEKSTGASPNVRVGSQDRYVLYRAPETDEGAALTSFCGSNCRSDERCIAYAVNSTDKVCFGYSQSLGEDYRLVTSPATNLYHKMCLPTVDVASYQRACPSQPYWSFERVSGHALDVIYNKTVSGVVNREACVGLCLLSGLSGGTEPICRSATYSSTARTCALSTETRFTRPTSFRRQQSTDYLENQCAQRSPASSCTYKSMSDVGVLSVDKLEEVGSAAQCQTRCDTLMDFMCRSFEFQPESIVGGVRRTSRCLLSGDNTITQDVSGATLPARPNSIYRERQCVTESCVNGIYTYEKMTGTFLRGATVQKELRVPDGQSAKTEYCLQQCSIEGIKCPAVYYNYNAKQCNVLGQNSQGRDEQLLDNSQTNTYFEKVCLRGQAAQQQCRGKAWAFERLLGYELSPGMFYQTINSVQSRRDCEEQCVSSVKCKSASYESDSLICKLSEYTRRTRKNEFRSVIPSKRTKTNYLENTCAPPPKDCEYQKFQDKTAVYADFQGENYPSEESCQNLCDTITTIVCRSFAYFPFFQRCYISADDGISASKNGNTVDKLGATYVEKDCSNSRTDGTTQRPTDPGCPNGVTIYEKMTSTLLTSATTVQQIAVPENEPDKSEYCMRRCTASGINCQAVHFNYGDFSCRILDQNSEGRSFRLLGSVGLNYFEKVCLEGRTAQITCRGKNWAFERVLGFQLSPNLYYRTESQVRTRRECEVKCLDSSSCKSALYEADTLDCKLSMYTRRSNAQDFRPVSSVRKTDINYLENQCVPVPASCSYNKFSDSQSSYADQVLPNVLSEATCKRECDEASTFVCRAYSYHSTKRTCMLSGDDSFSAGTSSKIQQFSSTYTERSCDITTTPTTTSGPPRPPSANCRFDEVSVLQKTMGYTAASANERPLLTGSADSPGITAVCKIRCADTTGCDAFVVRYGEPNKCTWISKDQSADDPSRLRKESRTSYFNHICVKRSAFPSTCSSKLWAFQRFPYSNLPNVAFKDSYQGISRAECQSRCLSSSTFVCRSIVYNNRDRICMLSDHNRITQRNFRLDEDSSTEYLENNCLSEKYSCRYNPQRFGTYMVYATRSVPRVTYQQCLTYCTDEPTFRCFSVSFFETGFGVGTCVLNSEDVMTAGKLSLQQRIGSFYADKVCDTTTPSTVAPPVHCQSNEYTFEKLTGYDVTGNKQEMNSIIDVKNLAKGCVDECKRLGDSCDAFVIDYSKKTCYSVKMPDRHSGGIFFPDQSYYIQNLDFSFFRKICAADNPCRSKIWTFDRVLNFHLADSVQKELTEVGTRQECERACLREQQFVCTSANYYLQSRICQMSSDSRRTQPRGFVGKRGVDYLENQCAQDPPSCKFFSEEGKYLPYTDKMLNKANEEDCRVACETEIDIPCRSYTYSKTNGDCLLSGDDTWSRPEGEEALRSGFNYANYVYGEKGRCEQVKVTCNEAAMEISFTFSQPFNGMVYARPKPKTCNQYGNGESQTMLSLPLGTRCGTIAESRVRYVNEVIIQKHRVIQTSSDKHVRVVCTFDSPEQVLAYGSRGLGREDDFQVTTPQIQPITSVVTNSVPPPPLRMIITDQNGREGHVVGIGDVLTLRIEFMNPQSTLGIFTRNLTAETVDGDLLTLIDVTGCPVDPNIFPPLKYDPVDGKSQFASFKAFRFPTSGYITFKARIHFCQDSCPPVRCADNMESVGRKRRDFSIESNISSDDDDLELGSAEDLMMEFNIPDPVTLTSTNFDESTEINDEESNDIASQDFIVVSSSTTSTRSTSTTSSTSTTTTTTTSTEPSTLPTTTQTITEPQSTTTTQTITEPRTTATSRGTTRVTKPSTSTESIQPTASPIPILQNRIIQTPPRRQKYFRPSKQTNVIPPPVKEETNFVPLLVPSDTPLKYSLLVSPDQDDYIAEDKAEGSAYSGIAPKTGYRETFSLYEKDEICSDRTTVIASIVSIVLIHVFVIISGICYYRRRSRRKNKQLDYAYTAAGRTAPPLPARNAPSAANNGILGRPNMTFRNIYGYTTAPAAASMTSTQVT